MPKSTVKFISGYLIPSLNTQRFGHQLEWVDEANRIFQIYWYHKGGPNWTEKESAVFVEWDKTKGHYKPTSKTYFTQSKQRFRAMLYKLKRQGDIKPIKSSNKNVKIYSIAEQSIKRRRRQSSSCESSEYEIEDNSGVDICDESNDMCRRRISEDNRMNVLEDHAYVSVHCMPGANSDDDLGFGEISSDPFFLPVYNADVLIDKPTSINSFQRKPEYTLESNIRLMTEIEEYIRLGSNADGNSLEYLLNFPACKIVSEKYEGFETQQEEIGFKLEASGPQSEAPSPDSRVLFFQ